MVLASGNRDELNALAGDGGYSTRLSQGRHRGRSEEATSEPGQPPRPPRRALNTGAVGCNAGIGVHLAIQLGEQYEGKSGTKTFQEARAPPDQIQRVEAIPDLLRARAQLIGGHRRVR